MRTPWLSLCGLVAAGLVAGCNSLTGVEDVNVDQGSQEPGATNPNNTGNNAAGSEDAVQGPVVALNCAYSPANPGVTKGKDLPASKHWQGFAAGSTDSMPIDINSTDFYDCTGTKGVHAVVYELAKFF